jgi:hypothetical protein
MMDRQMELSLEAERGFAHFAPKQQRQRRAQQWFSRMREAVERALDWQPAPEPRPEQTWFAATHPHAQPLRERPFDEQPICE